MYKYKYVYVLGILFFHYKKSSYNFLKISKIIEILHFCCVLLICKIIYF